MFSQKLIELYQQMADLTGPVCANTHGDGCMVPHSCCDEIYCNMAMERAEKNKTPLASTGHPKIPLMGPEGCIAPPYLRPVCTVHVCCINGLGFKPGDPIWTKKYFQLRNAINRLESGIYLDDL